MEKEIKIKKLMPAISSYEKGDKDKKIDAHRYATFAQAEWSAYEKIYELTSGPKDTMKAQHKLGQRNADKQSDGKDHKKKGYDKLAGANPAIREGAASSEKCQPCSLNHSATECLIFQALRIQDAAKQG